MTQAPFELGQLAAEVLDRGAQRAGSAADRVARVGALAQRVDHLADARGALLDAVALELMGRASGRSPSGRAQRAATGRRAAPREAVSDGAPER